MPSRSDFRPSSTATGDSAATDGMAFPLECPLCGCGNVAGSRFCMQCGSPVHLMACPQCDAVNARDSGYCYQCHASLAGRSSAEREAPAVAAAEPVRARPQSVVTPAVAPLTVGERPVASPDEGPAAQETATGVLLAEHSRVRPITVILLFVLTATAVAAVYAYYHQDTIEHLVATGHSAFARYANSGPATVTSATSEQTKPTLDQPVAADAPAARDEPRSTRSQPATQAAAEAADQARVAPPASDVNTSGLAAQEQSESVAPAPAPPTAEGSDALPPDNGAAARAAVGPAGTNKPRTPPRVKTSSMHPASKVTSPPTAPRTARGTSTSNAKPARSVMSTRQPAAPDVRRPPTPSRVCTADVAALGFCTTGPAGAR